MLMKLLGNKYQKLSEEIQRAIKLYDSLKRVGFNSEDEKTLLGSKDDEVLKDVIHLLRDGLFEPCIHENAKTIMTEDNFFGVDDAIKYLKVRPTHKQLLTDFTEIRYLKETLAECSKDYKLTAYFPTSIMDLLCNPLLERFWDQKNRVICKNKLKNQLFALNPGRPGFYLVRKSAAANTTSKQWIQQLQCLGNNRVASANILLYTMTTHFMKTGQMLFNDEYIHLRCEEEDSSHRLITVIPSKKGISIESWWGEGRADFVGVASIRKPDF